MAGDGAPSGGRAADVGARSGQQPGHPGPHPGPTTWTMEPGELRSRRRALGLTQAALARTLGVAPNTLARWERGELSVGNPVLIGIALERLERPRRHARPA